MSGYARVESVDAIRDFRVALVKFAETVNSALSDAESEAQRALVWLETEQDTYWQGQIRKRHEDVQRCKDAVRQKKLFKSPTGSTQSAVEEEKMLRVAQRRLEEAEQKLKNVRRWGPRLQKEIAIYKGGVSRLTTTVLADIPVALSRLDKMIAAVQTYASLSISGAGIMETAGEAASSMARAVQQLSAAADYSPLRRRTAEIDRAAAKAGSVRLESWSDGLVSGLERESLARIQSERILPGEGQYLVVEQGAWESGRIYLERVRGSDREPGDSGWLLGRADGEPPAAALRVAVSELLEVRPDLSELLALPAGFLIVIDVGGVAAVLDEHGADVWPGANPSPVTPPPPATPPTPPM